MKTDELKQKIISDMEKIPQPDVWGRVEKEIEGGKESASSAPDSSGGGTQEPPSETEPSYVTSFPPTPGEGTPSSEPYSASGFNDFYNKLIYGRPNTGNVNRAFKSALREHGALLRADSLSLKYTPCFYNVNPNYAGYYTSFYNNETSEIAFVVYIQYLDSSKLGMSLESLTDLIYGGTRQFTTVDYNGIHLLYSGRAYSSDGLSVYPECYWFRQGNYLIQLRPNTTFNDFSPALTDILSFSEVR